MEKKQCFLGFLASLVIAFFTANVFAVELTPGLGVEVGDYMCDTKNYTSCNTNYYMTNVDGNNDCIKCPANSTSNGGEETTCTCKSGYTDDGTKNGSPNTASTACIAVKYSIEYEQNGGQGCGTPAEYTIEDTVTLCTPAPRTGYTFKGWHDNSSLSGSPVFTIPAGSTGDKKFYAKWTANTYTLNYSCTADATGGTTPASQTTTYDATYTVAAATCQKAGYTYTKWTDGTSTYNSGETYLWQYTTDKTLTPVWESAEATITLNKNGGSGRCWDVNGTTSAEQSCTYGNDVTLPSWGNGCSLTKTNQVFIGWGESASAGSFLDSSITCPATNTTYYAQWCEPRAAFDVSSVGVNVTFEVDDTSNEPIAHVTCPEGYANDIGDTEFDIYGNAGDCEVYIPNCLPVNGGVVYSANAGAFNDNSKSKAISVQYGESLTQLTSEYIPTRAGYAFTGFTNAENDLYYNASGAPTVEKWEHTGLLKLFADWEQCGAGTYSDGSSSACMPCPTISDPDWSVTSPEGSTSVDKCYAVHTFTTRKEPVGDDWCQSMHLIRPFDSGQNTYGNIDEGRSRASAFKGGYVVKKSGITIWECHKCDDGFDSDGGAVTSCTECADADNVAEWLQAQWVSNTVINSCAIAECKDGYTLLNNKCEGSQYTVSYSCGEGAGTPPAEKTVTFGTSFRLALAPDPEAPDAENRCSYPNHRFIGWRAEDGQTLYKGFEYATLSSAADTTFVAQWEYSTCQSGEFHNGAACEPCPDGYTASDAQATDKTQCYRQCDYSCDHTRICEEASFVTGVASCSYETESIPGKLYYNTKDNECAADNSQTCRATYTCKPGYKSDVTGNLLVIENNKLLPGTYCEPEIYTITLNKDDGNNGSDVIYEKYALGYALAKADFDKSQLISGITIPAKENYIFKGYYTAQNGQGEKLIEENGSFSTAMTAAYFTSDATLYAFWESGSYTCVAGYGAGSQNDNSAPCAPGAYCPGGTVTASKIHDPIEGCQRACPADAQNGTVSSAAGASGIGQCYTTRTGALGGEGHGTGEQICNYSSTSEVYDNGCNTTIIACDAGYYRPLLSSTVCSPVGYGNFSVNGDLNFTECSTLNGAAANVTTKTQTSGTDTDCYNICNVQDIDNGQLNPVVVEPHYNGTTIPACDYNTTPVCDDGYEPNDTTCTPKVYEITLSDNGGTGGSGKVYLKYATGWFSNAAATIPLATVKIPTKADSDSFGGYEYDGITIIGADGTLFKTADTLKFTTQDVTITAIWDTRTPITCTAGSYYSHVQSKCVECLAGSYCEGVSTFVGVDEDKGIKTCASLNGTTTPALNASQTDITSAAGAQAATECYATNVAYTSDTKQATGSQTCYYRTGAYTDRCIDRKVLACAGGYYLKNTNDADCTEAGSGYYSPDEATDRTACPGKASNPEITTDKETSNNVQACFLGNIWLNPGEANGAAHGGVRRSCHHKATIDNANSTAGYIENCPVTEVVTCNAGYYLANNTDTDCVPVGEGYYSPAQSYFTSEPEKPTIEYKSNQKISSLLRIDCPAGSATGTDTAATVEWCCVTTKDVFSSKDEKIGTATWNGSAYNVANKCMYSVQCGAGYKATGLTNGVTANPKCVWADPNACPEDSFCPDGAEEPIECPLDENGNHGTTEGTDAKFITDCHIAYDPYEDFRNGTGTATCYYSENSQDYTRCEDINAKSCEAGFYYNTAGAASCVAVPSGQYSSDQAVKATSCPAGGNGSRVLGADNTGRGAKNWNECYKNCELTVAHSETVSPIEATVYGISAEQYKECKFNVTCPRGYTETNNGTSNPTCDANEYTVTLDKNGGTGTTAASVRCTFDSGACTLPDTAGLQRAGYTATGKWCTEVDGNGVCYDAGMTVTSNISENGTDMTLYATWAPIVYKVTLSHADANVTPSPIEVYLKYATGWFTGSDAIIPLSKLAVMPEKTGYEFAGYRSTNGVNVISATGQFQTNIEALTFTTTDTTINVVWSAGNTTCAAGYYYAGTGTQCNLCPEGSYCPGGSFPTDMGEAGKNACRDGGTTVASTAENPVQLESQCFKEKLPTYVAGHGKGTQTCYFDTDSLTYSADCKNKYITSCDAGYWQANKNPTQENPDCDEVGNGYYSGDTDISRTPCPNDGTTAETTAANVQRCFKTGLDYAATYGSGTQRCFYSNGDGNNAVYNRDCDDKTISQCRGGYWLDTSITTTDCSPVGFDFYSEAYDTSRHLCEDGGKTKDTTTSDPRLCYKGDEVYTAEHGGGYQTCYYTSGTGSKAVYETSCETPTLTHCDAGYYANIAKNPNDCTEVGYGFFSPVPDLERGQCNAGETTATPTSHDATACYTCPAGQVCDPTSGSQPRTCSDLTGGKYTLSDEGTTDVKQCYRDCAKPTHAATMTGRDYYGGTNTCQVAACMAGYYLQNGQCITCPAGMFCDGGTGDEDCPDGQVCDTPKSCAALGDGSWMYSDAGATGPKSCYRKCDAYQIEGGMAIPVSDRAYYDSECEFKGRDADGNPCEIQAGVCVVTSCKNSYKMENGKCVPCNIENALTYKTEGNCQVATCRAGFHPYGQSCEGDTVTCTAPNATRAEMQWNTKTNAFGVCTIKECEPGFHISSNACVADVQACTVENGRGEKEWNHKTNTWGECIATYCDPGYTNDPSESDDPTKQCGNCANKFGVGGEIAASTYSRGCTISACMYQGEMYNLENNECVPICSVEGYSDATGTMKWNPRTKKCERTCFDGYAAW